MVGISRADAIEFYSNYLKYGLRTMTASYVLLRVRLGMCTATSHAAILQAWRLHQRGAAWLVRWVDAFVCAGHPTPFSNSPFRAPQERAPQRLGNQETGIEIGFACGAADSLANWCGMTVQAVREHLREWPRCEPGLGLLAQIRWEYVTA